MDMASYYDRFFARCPQLKRIGLCFEHQIEEEIPVGEYDVKMHEIYTERGAVIPIQK